MIETQRHWWILSIVLAQCAFMRENEENVYLELFFEKPPRRGPRIKKNGNLRV
jgi:hypothetical protein